MNRAQAPTIQNIEKLVFPKIETAKLDNGIPIYMVNDGTQEVVKLDCVFEAGKWYEEKNLVADITNRMLREGTQTRNAKDLADAFDFYGCNLESGVSFGNAGFQLYSLAKNFTQVLPLLHELLTQPLFPADELETILSNRKEKHLQNLAKNDYLANRLFLSSMWGQAHPYGRVTEASDFEHMKLADLQKFYKQYYNFNNCFFILSGKFNHSLLREINRIFGQERLTGEKADATLQHISSPHSQLIHHVEKADAVQTTVLVGNQSINKYHADYDKLTVLNTVFGGYFGSRLMTNIREEKGYTYGIYSALSSYQHGGVFEINTEVGKEVKDATLKEIAHEIEVVKNERVGYEELETVKNYMAGKILRSLDGPLKFADVLKGLVMYNRDTDYLQQYLHTIQSATANELQDLAIKHFNFDKMYQVTVG